MPSSTSTPNALFWQALRAAAQSGTPATTEPTSADTQDSATAGTKDGGAVAYTLDELGIIEVKGPDAVKFLQGQLTADIEKLSADEAMFAGHCDHKGRLQSNFLVVRGPDDSAQTPAVLLLMQAGVCEQALAALQKYAVFSRCELRRRDSEIAVINCDQAAAEAISEWLMACTGLAAESLALRNTALFADSDIALPKRLLIIDTAAQALPQDSQAHHFTGRLGSAAQWQSLRVAAGLALLDIDAAGQHIPQMLNMDWLDGISWTKGCYTGQEIIARMKYRGSVNRRVYIVKWRTKQRLTEASLPAAAAAPAGTAILDHSGNAIGELIESATAGYDGNTLSLAVLKLKHLPATDMDDRANSQGLPCLIDTGDGQVEAALIAPAYRSETEVAAHDKPREQSP